MPEIMERGYIYIAQPPLYKVKKGKQERYIKDDEGLTEYLTTLALENAEIHVNESAPALSGLPLEKLVNQFRKTHETIKRVSRLIPADILEKMIYGDLISTEDFNNKEKLNLGQLTYLNSYQTKMVMVLFIPLKLSKTKSVMFITQALMFVNMVLIRYMTVIMNFLTQKSLLSIQN